MVSRIAPSIFAVAVAFHVTVVSFCSAGSNVDFVETRRATAVLSLSLDRAIAMALEKNLSLKVDAFNPRISQENLVAARSVFDPSLDLSYDHTQSRDGLAGPVIRGKSDDFDATVGGLTPWGLSYNVGAGILNSRNSAGGGGDNFSVTPVVGVTQPILRGFGTDSNMAGIWLARTNTLISEWASRQTVIDTVTDVYRVYNDLHLAKEGLLVAIRSRELAQQTLEDNERRAEIGVMSPLDVTQARAQAAAREEAVIVAIRTVKDQENFLKQLVTNDVEKFLLTSVEIEPPEPPAQLSIIVEQGVNTALQWRPDYQQALLDLRNQRVIVARTDDAALPRLDLVASLSFLGADGGLGDSASSIFDSRTWTAGAVFSMPFGNRSRRSDADAARLTAAQALVDLKRLEQNIVVLVDNAAGQVRTTIQRIRSTREARKLAEESLSAAEQRLQAGTGTTFEVLELQENLATAEVAELRAVADYNIAVSQYHRQTGTTLQFHNIVFTDLPRSQPPEALDEVREDPAGHPELRNR